MSNFIGKMCDCDISEVDFKSTTIHCPQDKSSIGIFNSTIVYSSESGEQTATRIAERMFRESSLSFNSLALRSDIVIEEVTFYNGSGVQSTLTNPNPSSGIFSVYTIVIAVCSFTAGILMCIGVLAVTYCVK